MNTPELSRIHAIEIENLTIHFGAVKALESVSFFVPSGSITGLIGRNGAGKSTSIRCLAGLLAPTDSQSRVSVLGLAPTSGNQRILASTGFLLSEPALFRYLTPRETLEFIGRAYGLDAEEANSRGEDLIEFFGLTEAADRVVDNFSTGMQKRLALAAAMIHSPSLLILDEPFEALDPLMVRSLKRLLHEYSDRGGTVLLSSHLIGAVEEICDRVVFLDQGRIVAAGETESVRASVADRLPSSTLEELYASLVAESVARPLEWLVNR